ncbi:gamma-glutamyltransferase family protein [Chitinasiproducens palmae]|uniref:Gamma-glutamyltranspeptidase / glutathione hydrolase n=1 Tax=Chitinasiproducens palmae TaxID=1770053 RepID=A0A1H2PW57_9BURK|nr:gamma-glutamyltransferase [Chitinasiproducens palmae]SDV51559.1 gamma-glutamyltranspeptidase / glutathione hydrolase [Chitinasiproducens palmae]
MQQSIQTVSKTSVRGRRGAVACARHESSAAAIAMLEAGGNAVDAAIAAALVAGVVEPMETTLAGSGFMLIHLPGEPEAIAVDFGPRAPLAARPDMFTLDTTRATDRGLGVSVVENDANVQGILAAGVPATLRGLTDAHRAHGRLPLRTVMQPAIAAAHDGFEVDSYYALEVLANLDALRANPAAASVFLRDGLPPPAPHLGAATLGAPVRLRQQALGNSLERIAEEGADAFYRGAVAESLLETVAELGGILATDDLAQCRSTIGAARTIRFRNVDVWVPNGPCGAITQIEMLRLWQAVHPDGAPLDDTPERIRTFEQVSRHAFADRYHWLGDAGMVPVPEHALTSIEYAQAIASGIANCQQKQDWRTLPSAPWEYFAWHPAHDPWRFEDRAAPAQWAPTGGTEPTSGTTHVSVIDGDGCAVSITHTAANHFGSKVVCPRTGFLFDAAMGWFNAVPGAANSIAGGKRPLANMAPMLLTRDGQSLAALGAPGGRRIISAIAQIAMRLVENGDDAFTAVHAPRYDASGPTLLLSERLRHVASEMPELAPIIRWVGEQHEGYGYELARPNIVVRGGDGALEAACDPFSKGFALAI